jgi:hypothetical protein
MSREEQAKLRESVELRDYYHELDHQSDRPRHPRRRRRRWCSR